MRPRLSPGQDFTPREGEERARILAPPFPGCRELKQFVAGCNSMTCDESLPLPIPALHRPLLDKGHDAFGRPVAYVVSECFNTRESRFLKKPAEPTSKIGVGNP